MGESFYHDLREMGRRYQLTRQLESVFEFENVTSQNKGVETVASSHVLEYYTPRTVKRVLEYFSIDYIMLNMPIPAWAEEMLKSAESDLSTS